MDHGCTSPEATVVIRKSCSADFCTLPWAGSDAAATHVNATTDKA